MPYPKAASVRGSASKRPEASKGGRSKGRRNFKPKVDTCSTSGQIQTPASAPENLQVIPADCEIRTNNDKQSNTLTESVAEVKKSSSSSSSEEEDSDWDSDSSGHPTFGEADLIAFHKIQDSYNPFTDSDCWEEEDVEELDHLAKFSTGEKIDWGEKLKNVYCDLCGASGHRDTSCTYQTEIPKEVTTLPPAYSIMCKLCYYLVEDCPHENKARYAVKKRCVNCFEWGDHWVEDCPKERRLKKNKA